MRSILLITALLFYGYAWSDQSEQPSKSATKEQIAHNNLSIPTSNVPECPSKSESTISSVIPVEVRPIDNSNTQSTSNKPEKNWFDRFCEDPVAIFTGLLFFATIALWLATRQLVIDAKETSKRQSRAFVFLEGFNVELTTGENAVVPFEITQERYRDEPGLWIARFAVQPRWKNSGNTPTKKMRISVNWRGPLDPNPPDFTYGRCGSNQTFFIAPQSIESSAFIDLPGVQPLVDYGWNPIGERPMLYVWGRAEYEDVFGTPHFIEWCYQVRFERHKKGNPLRASFIQWGDYNRSDE